MLAGCFSGRAALDRTAGLPEEPVLEERAVVVDSLSGPGAMGMREVDDQIWLVSFLNYDLGFFDNKENRVEPGKNPFAPEKV